MRRSERNDSKGGVSEKRIVEVLLLRLSDAVIGGAVTTKVAKLLDLLSDFEDVAQIVEHAKTVRKVSLFQECIKLASVMQFLEKHMEFRCKRAGPARWCWRGRDDRCQRSREEAEAEHTILWAYGAALLQRASGRLRVFA